MPYQKTVGKYCFLFSHVSSLSSVCMLSSYCHLHFIDTFLHGICHPTEDYTVEPLYCGHLPGEVSCIERCAHFRGKFILRETILGHSKVSII